MPSSSTILAHDKLGENKAALMDAKKVVAERWQRFARSSHLFHALYKDEAVLKMIDLALKRIKADDAHHRQELVALKCITKPAYHLGMLPVEILVEVFSIVVAADHAQILKLSHVCKHWHGIAIENPSLWGTLVVSKNRPSRKIQLWMERARTRISALSFHHNIGEMDWSSIHAELIPLTWCNLRSLTVSRDAFSQIYDLLRRLSKMDTIPRLTHLDIADVDLTQSLSSFEDSHLDSLGIFRITPSMNELWSRVRRLKTLTIKLGFEVDISRALIANPSLENLILRYLILVPPNIVNDRVRLLNLLCLKLLHVLVIDYKIMRLFVAPNLQVLHLVSIGLSDDVLLEFAQAPPRTLRELRLEDCTTSVGSLKMILAETPLLETLQISEVYGIVNDVLHFISSGTNPKDQHQDVCPLLKHVDISYCADLLTRSPYSLVKSRLRTDQLVTGDESRSCCRAEIETLRLDGCPNIEGEMLPWFREKVKVFSWKKPIGDVDQPRWVQYLPPGTINLL